MKKTFTFLMAIIFLTIIASCGNKDTKGGESAGSKSDVNAQISFSGSSTLAPVISKISTTFIEKYETWDKVDPSLPAENITIYVSSGGSGAGVKAVLDNVANFGMLARGIKDSEKEKVKEVKEEKGGNEKWSDLDKSLPNEDIVVVTRDLSGGAHEVFQKNVMKDVNVRQDAIQAPTMGALVAKIIENKNAIGYASFGITNQNKGKLIPLKVDNIEPSEENILNKSYYISRPLIIMKSGELTKTEKIFVDLLKSEEGKKVIKDMGFIPVSE